jgi:hypothetical protein
MGKSLTSLFCVKAHNFGAGDDTSLSSGWNCTRPILRVTLGVKIRKNARINNALIKIEDREERDPDDRYIVVWRAKDEEARYLARSSEDAEEYYHFRRRRTEQRRNGNEEAQNVHR